MKDLVIQGQYFYILQDYVNGGQLLHYIVKRQRLSDRRTRTFSRQIVSALDYLHRNSIVHRDLKIENIMIDKSGRNIKIIDFGLSNLFCPERQLTTYCGSLYFAAPELLKANPYSGPEVDVWSLGVVIYVMATGSVPFDDKSMPGLHDKIKKGHVTYPAHLSEECKELLSKIFVVDPKQRIIMTNIKHHPWILKDSAAINNYMPTRKPLTLPLNPKVIGRMSQGFNLGTPEEIEKRLTLIVESPVYHDAVQHIADCHARKSPTPPHNPNEIKYNVVYDDPQSVPAAYHPFLSLYYLAAERQIAQELEAHRVSVKSSLSRKASVESMGGGTSSANGSQISLHGADENASSSTGARLLIDVPTSHTPVMPQMHNASGVKLHNDGSLLGFVSQPAAIGSTNYLSRIQRWLRSSLSQHRLDSTENNNASSTGSTGAHVSAPPSPPQHVQDANNKNNDVDVLFVNNPATTDNSKVRLPTPSHSTDDREQQPSVSPNDSFHSTTAVGGETLNVDPSHHQQQQQQQQATSNNVAPAGGSKSLFRKLSQAFLRKNSTKTLNKKTSNLSNSNNASDAGGGASEEEVSSSAAIADDLSKSASMVDEKFTTLDDIPPPVPPKDIQYMASPPPRGSSMPQQLPPGMSIATVTSRQTAHTIDISAINNINLNNNRNSINNGSNTVQQNNNASISNISVSATPIAAKMAKYDVVDNSNLSIPAPSSPNPTVSRSASLATPSAAAFHHRRRGSISKMAGKINSFLNRSTSFNHHASKSSSLTTNSINPQ